MSGLERIAAGERDNELVEKLGGSWQAWRPSSLRHRADSDDRPLGQDRPRPALHQ